MEDILLKEILKLLGFENAAQSAGLYLAIIAFIAFIIKYIRQIKLFFNRRRLAEELDPFYTYNEIKKYTQHYVPGHFQNIPPSIKDEPRESITAKARIIPFFLKQGFRRGRDMSKYYLVLADSGMGKTAFMINLYKNYVRQWFRFQKRYQIKLLPLGYSEIDHELQRIKDDDKKNTILLLDALDEDPKAVVNYEKRLDEVMGMAWRFREVVITCRTQFFPNAHQERYEIKIPKFATREFHTFEKLYLSPFDKKDIRRYLNKKYGLLKFWNINKKKQAKRIVNQSPNLMVRPMLLSNIDDLINNRQRYRYSHQIYARLIEKWIERETQRVAAIKRPTFKHELYRFSKQLAMDIYRKRHERQGLYFSKEDIKPLVDRYQINLESWEMTGRSLLNRNEAGQFKFSHKSILEYFLALEAINNPRFENEIDFSEMPQAEQFFDELCWLHYTIPYFKNPKRLEGYYSTTSHEYVFKFRWQRHNDRYSKANLKQIELHELSQLVQLRIVNFSNKDMNILRGFKQMTHLDLRDCNIRHIKALRPLKKLQKLNLAHNAIKDIKALAGLNKLQDLYLSYNNITDIGALTNLSQLKWLDLQNNPIAEDQIEALQVALPDCIILFGDSKQQEILPDRVGAQKAVNL